MLLEEKTAVVYGGGGAIGGAVARAFAREGAAVFVTGRRRRPVEDVAADIRSAGGRAEAAVVDALDEAAVEAHLHEVVGTVGRVDISFNAVGMPNAEILGVPLVDLTGRPLAADTGACLTNLEAEASADETDDAPQRTRRDDWLVLRAPSAGTYRIAAPYKLPRGTACPTP